MYVSVYESVSIVLCHRLASNPGWIPVSCPVDQLPAYITGPDPVQKLTTQKLQDR